MKHWLFFALVVALLVLVNGHTYERLQTRTRALDRAVALGESQRATIERQTGLLERQTAALNECSAALARIAQR
jgi:hypothetical protein